MNILMYLLTKGRWDDPPLPFLLVARCGRSHSSTSMSRSVTRTWWRATRAVPEGLRLRRLRGRGAEPLECLRERARDRLGCLVLNLMPLQHVQQPAVAEDRNGR